MLSISDLMPTECVGSGLGNHAGLSFSLSEPPTSVSTGFVHQRLLTAEILDALDQSNPRAIRSRCDLRWINAFLGNERHILRELDADRQKPKSIVELGAGEGILCARMAKKFPETRVTGLDLAPRPSGLPESVDWVRGDFFQTLPGLDAETCVGSLILHHFSDEALLQLGRHLGAFRQMVYCEPLRSSLPLFLSRLATPFAGEVTRHDMPASIRAGFRKGELPSLLGLASTRWRIFERESLRGTVTMIASRK